MGKSAAIMKSMNSLIRAPEVMDAMRRMSEEMQKAGIIEEMLGAFWPSNASGAGLRGDWRFPGTFRTSVRPRARLFTNLMFLSSFSRTVLQAMLWIPRLPKAWTKRLMR